MRNSDRRLIEDLIPIREISAEASREKSLRHGNISTLHLWWARRPTVAARAAVYGALVPAPVDPQEREEYMKRMRKLCTWNVSQKTLDEARQDILAANGGQPPRVLDMFAGGGSIPLEAMRLGCESYAVDLNPVAHIIELCTLYYPQKYGPSLAEDVKKWGTWTIAHAQEQLASFYPTPTDPASLTRTTITQELWEGCATPVQTHQELTPIAYLWTRTVPCPNPTCGATVPLVRQTWLKKKAGNYVALRMLPDAITKKVHFEKVEATRIEDLGFDPEAGSSRGNTVCLHCGGAVTLEYIKQKGLSGNIGQELMAIIVTRAERKGKRYVSHTEEQTYIPAGQDISQALASLLEREKLDLPREHVQNQDTLNIKVHLYGLTTFADLFTSRQLLSLLTFTATVHHAHAAMLTDGMDDERARAVTTYLGLMVDRLAENLSSLCRWNAVGEKIQGTFGRQALPMVWDFAEANPFGGSVGDASSILANIIDILGYLDTFDNYGHVLRTSATSLAPITDIDALITDPPYYDNVSYADLSDFFYVWLKRSIGFLYPEHLYASLTPKKQEAVMAAYRHNKNKNAAKHNYETMMSLAFAEAHRVLKPGSPLICVYAHKTTSGWSTLIEALRTAGFIITEAWPLDTEMKSRSVAQGTAALASSIFLVARRRENESTGDYVSQVRPQLLEIIQERLDTLLGAGVTGADLVIATIGAGLRAYTQFARVELSNGDELDAQTYLEEVEREVAQHVLQRLLSEVVGTNQNDASAQMVAVDIVTRFYVTARFFYEEAAVTFDNMNMLARGMGVELDGPRGLTQGKKGLASKVKDTIELRDYRARGDDDILGLATESGNTAPLIDILQRLLWLQEKQPHAVPDFLLQARVNTRRLRLVVQALAGHALTPTSDEGIARQERTEEQKAIDRLLAGWRNLFTETNGQTLWDK